MTNLTLNALDNFTEWLCTLDGYEEACLIQAPESFCPAAVNNECLACKLYPGPFNCCNQCPCERYNAEWPKYIAMREEQQRQFEKQIKIKEAYELEEKRRRLADITARIDDPNAKPRPIKKDETVKEDFFAWQTERELGLVATDTAIILNQLAFNQGQSLPYTSETNVDDGEFAVPKELEKLTYEL